MFSDLTKKTREFANRMKRASHQDDFPVTLQGFEYHFNDAGQLRHIKTDIPFRFEVKPGDQDYNQRHYEALGQVVEEHLYQLLVDQEQLEKVEIPLDAVGREPRSFIFKSKDMEKQEKLLILIHGSGVVRAGQWSRSLIINHSLESGSQIPYIRKAKEEGYGVIVLNSNQNSDVFTGKGSVRGSERPSDHFLYVWDKIVMQTAAKHIGIMAHSYGGCVVVGGLMKRPGEMMDRVFAVALSDSVHSCSGITGPPKQWFIQLARNWVSSKLPLNSRIGSSNRDDCKMVSAGTQSHVETSWYAFSSVFRFMEKRLKQRLQSPEPNVQQNARKGSLESQKPASHTDQSMSQGADVEASQAAPLPNVFAGNTPNPKTPIEHEEGITFPPQHASVDREIEMVEEDMPALSERNSEL